MSGRGSRVRFPAASEVGELAAPVPAIGPIVFTRTFGGVGRTVDLSDLPCPKLVRPLAAALASIGGDEGTVRTWSPGFAQLVAQLRAFITFAAAVLGQPGAGLAEVTPQLMDGFEAELAKRFGAGGMQVGVFMRTVVRLMRMAGEQDPRALPVSLQARLCYSASEPCVKSSPLDAYPLPALDAINAAALADVRAIAGRIDAGRRAAAGGSDPRVAGWSARQNVLWHVQARGPLTAGQMAGLRLDRHRHGGMRELNTALFIGPHDLVPFAVAVICATGLEPECVKGLRAECLSSPGRGFASLAYDKKRAHTRTAKTMRVRDGGPSSAGGLIRLAARLTGPARQATGSQHLWVGACDEGLSEFFSAGHQMNTQVLAWMARHRLGELIDYGGGPVRLDLRRLRKSVKSRQYLASGGVLDDFTSGHSKSVAAAHYADIGAHREIHEQAVEAGLRQALEVALPPPVVLPAGTPPPEPATPAQIQAAASADTDVFLASCTGFDNSPFARDAGKPCPVPMWGCLECPNAVFTDRHLPSLVDFGAFLDRQRETLTQPVWNARYGLAHQRLTTGVLSAFPQSQLDLARSAAHDGPATLPAQFLEQLT
ncbi:MAG: hypothetical protein ACRDND_01885 [Streptosporangiaceae bacterium]